MDPDDIDALAKAIEVGLCDMAWRAKARATGLSIALGHSWERCIEETVCVYRRLLAGALGEVSQIESRGPLR